MSCGCVVIGTHGNGARDLLLPEFSFPVEQGDIIQFCHRVESAIDMFRGAPDILANKARKARSFVELNYSRAVAEKELLAFWSALLQ